MLSKIGRGNYRPISRNKRKRLFTRENQSKKPLSKESADKKEIKMETENKFSESNESNEEFENNSIESDDESERITDGLFKRVACKRLNSTKPEAIVKFWKMRLQYEQVVEIDGLRMIELKQCIDSATLSTICEYDLQTSEKEITNNELRQFFINYVDKQRSAIDVDFGELLANVDMDLSIGDADSRCRVFYENVSKILKENQAFESLKNPQTFKIFVPILLERVQPIQVRRTTELHLKQEEKVQTLLRFSKY